MITENKGYIHVSAMCVKDTTAGAHTVLYTISAVRCTMNEVDQQHVQQIHDKPVRINKDFT